MIIGKLYNYIKYRLWRLYSLMFRKFVLDIHLADHCNLNCKSCNHYSPLAEPAFRDLKRLNDDLTVLGKFWNSFKTIRLLGGEPLLNPQITEAVEIVRKHFPTINIEIVTNGILLGNNNIMKEDFWNVCRKGHVTLAVTEYPIAVNYDKIRALCLEKSIKLRFFENRCHGNSFNYYKLNPKGTEPTRQYYGCVENSCLQLREGRLFSCAPAAYVEFLNNKFNVDFKIRNKDFLNLSSVQSSFDIRKFLLHKKPFCSYCVFPRKSFRWERSNKKAYEWIEA